MAGEGGGNGAEDDGVGTADDSADGDDPDWQMAPDVDAAFPADEQKRDLLREVAEEVRARGDSSEAAQVSAFLYRVSDLYTDGEETSPAEIYLNVRHIMEIKERGGLNRGRDDE